MATGTPLPATRPTQATERPADRVDAGIIADLAEALADVLYVIQLVPEFRFDYVSASVEALLGYTPAEHYADPAISTRLVDPADLEAFVVAVATAPDGPFELTQPWVARDGRRVWAQHRCLKATRESGAVVLYGAARDVTAQVEAQESLAASQEMYRMLAENASDVVWRTNTEALVEWVSPSVSAILGWTPDDMRGTRITDLVHPEDLEGVQIAGTAANHGDRVSFEARYACKDGSYRWLEVTARPAVDADGNIVGRVGSCRDVQSEIETWHALERSEQRFRLAMESAPTGMAVLDLDGAFIEVNAALCRMLGRTQEWLLDHDTADVLTPADEPVCTALREGVLSGQAPAAHDEVRLVHADGAVVWAQVSIGLLRDEDGAPLSLVAQFVNVTEAHEAREALRFMASHDSLTHLMNRRELLARMSLILAHPPRGDARMGVLFADLDGLKPVNDTLGHAAGDQVIVESGQRIGAAVRDEDLVARLGGDEFIVVLPDARSIDDVAAVAAKVRRSIEEPMLVAGTPVPMGVSIGIAMAEPGDDATALLHRADQALYRAKAAGRNRIEAYAPGGDAPAP